MSTGGKPTNDPALCEAVPQEPKTSPGGNPTNVPQEPTPRTSPYSPGCWFGRGVLSDVRARLPFYTSDWVDGLNSKGLSSGVFVFFSQAIPATAFAGYLHESTGGELGVPETLLSMGIGGCLFSILAGQPLVIVGVTGPVTIFLATLYTLALQWQIPFRGWLFWVSMWAAAMHCVLGLCSAPLLFMRSVTAFSGDVFGCLIGVIYIVEGVRVLSGAFSSATIPVGAALLSLLLGLGAWLIASTLSTARSFTYLPALLRALLADYALPLAVVIASAAQFLPSFQPARAGLLLLPVPDTGSSSSTSPLPSTPHPWLDGDAIASVALWARGAAAVPAAVLTALLFFDHNISSSLSQEPRFNLKKPPAFNLDTLLLGVSLALTGLLSLPPNYGLIPQAPLHVRSLATIQQQPQSPGGGEVWVGVVETRVSPLIQSALLLALLASPLMRLLGTVPMGVLAGVLLYLGIEGLRGNGVVSGLGGLIKRAWGGGGVGGAGAGAGAEGGGGGEAQATTSATPTVTPLLPSISATCTVVGVQCCAVVGIFFITTTVAGIAFPAAILALIPIRLYLLPLMVGAAELEALDARGWGAAAIEGAWRRGASS